ncbi:hypothetical protein [Sporosarcina psychrophila]|uniref:DUF2536 domain-containing protein n=1 Tax=Sporosarcina psychrophila TaxID=1476 RepID=A0ABV2KE45_SPOPS
MMEIAQRKELRIKKVKELYEFNIEHAGREATIKFEDLHTNEQDKEEHLAYEYLAEKGLISYTVRARNMYAAKITAYGIDYVEDEK